MQMSIVVGHIRLKSASLSDNSLSQFTITLRTHSVEHCFVQTCAAKKNVKLIYYKKDLRIERRGLSESKNKGLNLANNYIVFVLDDDVELCQGFLNTL